MPQKSYARSAEFLAKIWTPEARTKQSERFKGKTLSEETKSKLSTALRGRQFSAEHRSRLSLALKGKKKSPEIIAKMSKSLLGRKMSSETRLKMSLSKKGKPSPLKGRPSPKKGRKCGPLSEEHKKKIGLANLGRKINRTEPAWNKGKVGCYKASMETRLKMRASARRGENHYRWKGGISPTLHALRESFEYRIWRESVFKREDYKCQNKTSECTTILRAHHIRNFIENPDFRFLLENGITFCRECHHEFHRRYGIKFNTLAQLEEFLGRKFQPAASRSDTDSGNACDTDAIASPLQEDSTARHNIERPGAVSELVAETKVAA